MRRPSQSTNEFRYDDASDSRRSDPPCAWQIRSRQHTAFHPATQVELIQPIAMEEGLGFAIREGGRTVGSGRVTKITK